MAYNEYNKYIKPCYYVKTKEKVFIINKKINKVKEITAVEAAQVKKTGKYTFIIWPDNDCYHYTKEFDVELFEVKTTKIL